MATHGIRVLLKKEHAVCWIGVAAALVIGFAGGTWYGKSAGIASGYIPGEGARAGMTGGRPGGRMMGGGFTAGSITAKDSNSITVVLGGSQATANGTNSGARIVLFSTSTQIAKSVVGSLDDLSVGEEVTVSGTPNPDGSITARSIQLRPAGSLRTGNRPGGYGPSRNQ